MKTGVALLVPAVFAISPVAGVAGETQIMDVRELAGTWRGWVTAEPGQMRVGGQYYIQDGKVRYRSSRSSGTATVSEKKGKTILTIVPEGIPIRTGRTQYERVK